jgi:hypothetical protein
LEWGPAAYAIKLRVKRLGSLYAAAAYGKPGDLAQSFATDAAMIGEEKGKKGVGGGTYY